MVCYVHPEKPILLRRMGWGVGDDVHDGHTDSLSYDNGKTWTEPTPAFSSRKVDGGFLVYVEFATLLHEQRGVLITVTNQKFETSLEQCSLDNASQLYIEISDPLNTHSRGLPWPIISDFEHGGYIIVSFTRPLLDSRGRIVVPIEWQKRDDGSIAARGVKTVVGKPHLLQNVFESGMLIGEFSSEDPNDLTMSWHIGNAIPLDYEKSSRGLMEPSIAELADGRLAAIVRGSNVGWPEVPGYKWLTFSKDGGENWSEAKPLTFDDSSIPQSGSTGSGVFRSRKTNKLYWMGTLCENGAKANGNWPRTPLHICEIQEEPFALKRSTLTAVAGCGEGEDEFVQHSNFKFYQDRETAEIVLYLTRYGERGSDGLDWMKADQYGYRIDLEE